MVDTYTPQQEHTYMASRPILGPRPIHTVNRNKTTECIFQVLDMYQSCMNTDSMDNSTTEDQLKKYAKSIKDAVSKLYFPCY